MVIETQIWDAADYLKTPADIAAYLDASLEDGTAEDIRTALGTIARARGMTEVAKASGLMLLAFALGIGLGIAQPMVMALLHDAVPEGRTGEAVGVRTTVITTGQTVMPLLFGALGSAVGVKAVFWAVALALVLGSRAAKKRPT